MRVRNRVAKLSHLKPGGRRNEKAGLEESTDVCYLVQVSYYCERNSCKHVRLGSVQTGKLLLIGQRLVFVQTHFTLLQK